jgi:hypothetical protein
VDRLQPLAMTPPARFVDTAEAGGGRVAAYQSGGVIDKRLWVSCFLVGGACYADAGGYRRAVLASLARDPLAKAGFIVLSQPAGAGATGSTRPEHYRSLLAAMDQLAASVAPSLAGRGK